MRHEISFSLRVGIGSEQHNHDVAYRNSLDHVFPRPDGVIELVEPIPYETKICEFLQPFFETYNENQIRRRELAEAQAQQGLRKRPRKGAYATISGEKEIIAFVLRHKSGHNPVTGRDSAPELFRSIILEFGDMSSRLTGAINDRQALQISREITEKMQTAFPSFLLLGSTLHLDERGAYHLHIDYFPYYTRKAWKDFEVKPGPDVRSVKKLPEGFPLGFGLDAALADLGYKPERSWSNNMAKPPIFFNAFRNRLTALAEKAFHHAGLAMAYGVTDRKDPNISQFNGQPLSFWQSDRDTMRVLQSYKNHLSEVIDQDLISPESVKMTLKAIISIEVAMDVILRSPLSLTKDHYRVTEKNIKAVEKCKAEVMERLPAVVALAEKGIQYQKRNNDLQADISKLQTKLYTANDQILTLQRQLDRYRQTEEEKRRKENSMAGWQGKIRNERNFSSLKQEYNTMETFLKKYRVGEKTLFEYYCDKRDSLIENNAQKPNGRDR